MGSFPLNVHLIDNNDLIKHELLIGINLQRLT